jgi:hypothetical protein
MNQSESIAELAAALAKAQGEITPAIKDNTNPFFKSKYADLTSIWNACRGPLSKNGLAVIQTMELMNEKMILVTTLAHSSGQWIKSFFPILAKNNDAQSLAKNNDAQSLGSATTYAKRYALSAIAGVTTDEDDDGCAVSTNPNAQQQKRKISKDKAEYLEGIFNQLADKNFVKDYKGWMKDTLKANSCYDLTEEQFTGVSDHINSIYLNQKKWGANV